MYTLVGTAENLGNKWLKSRRVFGKNDKAKTQQQMAVKSLSTRVQSPYSHFPEFTTITT